MAAISAALQQCKKSGKDPGGEGSSSRRGRSGAPAPLDLERGSNYLAGPGAYRVLGPRRFLVPTNARGNENGERGSRDGSLEEQAARADLEGAEIAASSAGRRASSAPLTSTALSTGTGPETMLYPVEASLVDHRTAGGRRNTAGESESCACGGGSTMWPSNRTACPGGRAAVGVCNLRTFRVPVNVLTGSIPSSLQNLTKVGTLDVGNNRLTGTIPSALGHFTALEYLALCHNDRIGSVVHRHLYEFS